MAAATLEPLEPLLPILNAFIHRHKNQHSSSHWFRYVPILRRSLRSLLLSSTKASALSSSKAAAAQDARLKKHATWLQSNVLPRCFLTFSQLAADNQHAPIGLLLIALLARVNTVLEAILPPPPPPPTTTTNTSTIKTMQKPFSIPEDHADRGTAIARPSPSITISKTPKTTTALPSQPEKSTQKSNHASSLIARGDGDEEPKPKRIDKVKKRRLISEAYEGESLSKSDKDKDKKSSKPKTKKKKKAGDAFSDMFAAL